MTIGLTMAEIAAQFGPPGYSKQHISWDGELHGAWIYENAATSMKLRLHSEIGVVPWDITMTPLAAT